MTQLCCRPKLNQKHLLLCKRVQWAPNFNLTVYTFNVTLQRSAPATQESNEHMSPGSAQAIRYIGRGRCVVAAACASGNGWSKAMVVDGSSGLLPAIACSDRLHGGTVRLQALGGRSTAGCTYSPTYGPLICCLHAQIQFSRELIEDLSGGSRSDHRRYRMSRTRCLVKEYQHSHVSACRALCIQGGSQPA